MRPAFKHAQGQLRNCPRHNRQLAVAVLVGSALVMALSVPSVSRPFPVQPHHASSEFWLALLDAMLLLLFVVRFRCSHERLWIAAALAGGSLALLEEFLPGLGGPPSILVNAAFTASWLAATVIGVSFVRSAFKTAPDKGGEAVEGKPAAPGGLGPTCPACGSPIARRTIRLASRFRCPACSAELSARPLYRWRSAMIGLIIACGVAALFSPTHLIFAIVSLAVWFPATWAAWAASKRVLPPPLALRKPPGGSSEGPSAQGARKGGG